MCLFSFSFEYSVHRFGRLECVSVFCMGRIFANDDLYMSVGREPITLAAVSMTWRLVCFSMFGFGENVLHEYNRSSICYVIHMCCVRCGSE